MKYLHTMVRVNDVDASLAFYCEALGFRAISKLCVTGASPSARELAEDVLQDKALNGIVEQLFYHGEVVDTRTRFDGRLLLALLGRLDKRAESRTAAPSRR